MNAVATGRASGFQIAFLIFAVVFLCAPATIHLRNALGWSGNEPAYLDRLVIFAVALFLLILVPGLRRASGAMLADPIPGDRRPEVLVAIALKCLVAFAYFGAMALWYRAFEIDGLFFRLGLASDPAERMSRALAPEGLVHDLLVAGLLGPVVEEIAFRGLLYRAWEVQWGWIRAMLASSFVFALFHPTHVPESFVSSLIFVCVLRRTGTLWGPIAVHCAFNLLVTFPLLGRFLFIRPAESIHEMSSWILELACLAVAAVAIPGYAWISRDAALARRAASPQPIAD